MSVPEQIPYIEYMANGVTTTFGLGYECSNPNELLVLKDGVPALFGTWSLISNSVIFNEPPSIYTKITIERNSKLDRTTEYSTYDNSFKPEAVNDDFDRIIYMIQEVAARLLREIAGRKLSDSDLKEFVKDYVESILSINNPEAVTLVLADIVQTTINGTIQTQQEFNEYILNYVNIKYPSVDEFIAQIQQEFTDLSTQLRQQINTAIDNAVGNIDEGFVKTFDTTAELLAFTPPFAPYYAKALDTFYVHKWNGTAWSTSGLSELERAIAYVNSFDALTLNKNKVYPLRRITRNSISANTPRPEFNTGLLKAEVYGAVAGEIYRIAIMQNGDTANGTAQGIQLEVIKESTVETSGAAAIVNARTSANQLTLNYAKGGIQTVNIVPDSRPDLLFKLTFDVDYLNTIYGTAILSATTASAGYNFIIDKSLYVNHDRLNKIFNSNSVSINQDKTYPFTLKTRGGITSSSNGYFTRAFLNVEVLGAEIGKYYRIAFFQNGNVAPDSDGYGWILEEFDAATYETVGTATRLKYYTDDNGSNPVLQPNTGIKTIVVKSTLKPNIIFKITVDTAYLPASGTAVAASNTGSAGYSWIIDPSCYYPISVPNQDLEVDLDQIYYTFDATTGQLNYAYRSGASYYRVWFGYVGFNNLPNFYRVDKAPANVSIHNAIFAQIMATTTDYLSPLRFSAVNNGDGSTFEISTGGNHGSDGTSGGSQTARNKLFKLFVDGQVLTTSRSGYARSIKAVVLNEIMAWNTITLNRYPVQQSFNIDFTGSGAKVSAKVMATEEINLTVDNGLQTITGGFNTSQIIANSQYTARKPFDNNPPTASSGAKSSYPNADTLVMRHYANGDFVTWTDRSFGIGDGRHVSSSTSLIQIRGVNGTKFYSVQVYGTTLNMTANQFYEYAGGYYWGVTTADTSYDSVYVKYINAVFVTNDAKEIVV
ncbi:hypothetical protein PY247_12965 [Acinetobacter proteolyticus]|nr:hypothetical protein [Acinetobacter proteolyticus]WEI17400.1 hypothetical protein PY247_12965 [Acinetobacter proteolyticus]